MQVTGGSYNTALGYNALPNMPGQARNYNTAVGAETILGDGSERTALGYSANSLTNYVNNMGLGYDTDCTAAWQVRIGNSEMESIGGYENWTNVSDRRFKKNVKEDVRGLDFILKLRPVTYTLDQHAIEDFFFAHYGKVDSSNSEHKYRAEKQIRTGFLAQEVEAAAKSLGYDFSGVDAPKNADDFYGLRYAEFTVPLVKAVQEQQAEIERLNAKIARLEALMEKIVAEKGK
jgi:hypothetical protein